jgi:hypothetical protein
MNGRIRLIRVEEANVKETANKKKKNRPETKETSEASVHSTRGSDARASQTADAHYRNHHPAQHNESGPLFETLCLHLAYPPECLLNLVTPRLDLRSDLLEGVRIVLPVCGKLHPLNHRQVTDKQRKRGVT